MDKKTTGIVAYITLVGWLIAYFTGDKEGAKFHLNQSLVLLIAELIAGVISRITVIGSIVGGILSIVLFVFWIMGLVYACKDEEKEVPVLGAIKILNQFERKPFARNCKWFSHVIVENREEIYI